MPIRPENKVRYPPDWNLRSRFVRIYRAKNRCEWCGAKNGQPHPVTGSKVVLTAAHVFDKRPEAASLLNLAALCQRCHLRHDAQDRAPMKAITIQQPWAHLIIHGFLDPRTGEISRKNIENRSWRSSYKGPLLIHAGHGRDYMHSLSDFPGLRERDISFGVAIGIVEMFGCIRHKYVKDIYWAEGPWCHQYRNARAFPSTIPWKGALGLWDVPRELMLAIQAIGSIDLADFSKPMRRLSSV